MKLKLKNRTNTIILAVVTILTFSSCKDFNKVMYGDIDAESIEQPSVEKIKKDILNSKVGNWTFAKLEEFNTVTITNSRVVDEFNLELEVNLDMSDYITGKPYQGTVTINYSRSGKNTNYWEFKEVTGTISKVESEDDNSGEISSESNYQDEEQSQQETRREYRICDWCGKEIVGQIYSISSFRNEVVKGPEYEGGIYHQNCAYEYLNTKGR